MVNLLALVILWNWFGYSWPSLFSSQFVEQTDKFQSTFFLFPTLLNCLCFESQFGSNKVEKFILCCLWKIKVHLRKDGELKTEN